MSLVNNSPSFHLPSFITISGNNRHNSNKARKWQQIVIVVLNSKFRSIHRQYELVDFKKAYYSVRREVLYNILIGFGVPKKLVRLVKMLSVD